MKLSQVVPWGRSRDEYIRMFSLLSDDLKKRILGCGDGPASFNAQQTEAGAVVVSLDPIYSFSKEELEQRIHETVAIVREEAERTKENYNWTVFKDPEDLCQARLATMQRFLKDYEKGKREGRYVSCSLPERPDIVDDFDLALCSHLLFLYSEQLSSEFHLQTIQVLMEYASEARIFPIMDLAGEESAHLQPVLECMHELGYRTVIEEVDYEFRKGMKHMLRIIK